MTEVVVRGLRYHVERWGAGRPLLLLHGFTGSAETWRPFRAAWPGYALLAVDLVGHGRTELPADLGRATMASAVDDVVALLEALRIEQTAVLGYSMGGRVALRLALAAPNRVSALVLESASPGIASAAERRARIAADDQLARLVEEEGIAAFVAQWEALPLWASQARLPADTRERLRQQRLASSPAGLALSLRGMGAGRDEPVLDRLGELPMPVLLVVGADDHKYRLLAQAMAARLPNAQIAVVPDAGHTPHLEQPSQFATIVGRFLDASNRSAARACRSS
jgi:2-succinyl-6-hydroxy-2,4-cyclohexadiene-1-carboxylate synthase